MAEIYTQVANTSDLFVNFAPHPSIQLTAGVIRQGQFRHKHIVNNPTVNCSVLFLNPVNQAQTLLSLWKNFGSNCKSLVRVFGMGRLNEDGSVFAVIERVNENVLNYFMKNNLKCNGTAAGCSYDDDSAFLKEDVSKMIRAGIKAFSDAVDDDVFPKINGEGADTFVVNGNYKWLFVDPNGKESTSSNELVILFRRILDTTLRTEEESFFTTFDRICSYYHPFVLTEMERERFAYRLDECLRGHELDEQQSLLEDWVTTLRQGQLDHVTQLHKVIFDHRGYRNNLVHVMEFLRNFARHIFDVETQRKYQKALKDNNATLPLLRERNIATRDLLGMTYLINLWTELSRKDFIPFIWGQLI